MDKEDQIINRLQAIEQESKLIRSLLTVLLALVSLVSLFMLVNGISD
jgi:uncharacterized membrane protein